MRSPALSQLAVIGVLCTLLPTQAGAEPMSDDDAFEQVFKHKPASERIPVVLVVQDKTAGSVIVDVRNGSVVRIPATVLLEALATAHVRTDLHDRLARAARGGFLAAADLRAAGLDVTYDAGRLELRIGLAAGLTETSSHTLAAGVPAQAATALRPSDVSGYVNFYGHGGTATPGSVLVDSATSIHGWLLEARGGVAEAPIGVHRGDVLLSHDVPDQALRYLAGDFAISPGGLQPGFPILGVGVTRNFALQPYRVIQPIGSFEFTLDRPAKVTVMVNGIAVQTLDLPAGRHDVRDLPLVGGTNDIELLIRDDAGGERRLQFSAVSPNELLAPGVVQFSVSVGFPLIGDVGLREYDWRRPVMSGRRRWGVSEHLTLGGSVDGDLDRQVGGSAVAVATRLGNLGVDAAGSHDRDAHFGHAESVRYDHLSATNTLTIAARHYSPQFRSLEVLDVDGRYSGDVSVAVSRLLAARLYGRANVRYQVGRDTPNAYDGSFTFSRSFGALSLDALFGVRATGTEPRDERVFVTARWRLPDRSMAQGMSRTSASAGTSNELRFTTAPGPPPGGLVASAGVHEDRATVGTDATVAYASSRFTSSVTGAMSLARDTTASSSAGSFEVGTALAFAGGHVAWSRPITGSFAIVDRNPTLAGQDIGVNRSGRSFSERADRFGPAVVPNLEAYRVGSVRVEAPNLRLGTSLGPASYTLLPSYKSGTLLRVGEPGTVFLRGTLRHADGTPVELAVGELDASDGATSFLPVRSVWETDLQWQADQLSEAPPNEHQQHRQPFVIMTNRGGRFSVVGITPGHYEIRIPSGAPIGIDVPAGVQGVYSAGDLVMQPSP